MPRTLEANQFGNRFYLRKDDRKLTSSSEPLVQAASHPDQKDCEDFTREIAQYISDPETKVIEVSTGEYVDQAYNECIIETKDDSKFRLEVRGSIKRHEFDRWWHSQFHSIGAAVDRYKGQDIDGGTMWGIPCATTMHGMYQDVLIPLVRTSNRILKYLLYGNISGLKEELKGMSQTEHDWGNKTISKK